MRNAVAAPAESLLTPRNHTLAMIDHQSQMAFATRSIDGMSLRNNAALLARAAAGFGVPTILSTVAEQGFSGAVFPEIAAAFPQGPYIGRSSMNSWEDAAFIARVNLLGHTRVVLSGLWTSVCIAGPALSALEQGFQVYVVTDACGDVSAEAHERALQRMLQAGVKPMTSLQYLLELQRDWARRETCELTSGIVREFGGIHGLGILSTRPQARADAG